MIPRFLLSLGLPIALFTPLAAVEWDGGAGGNGTNFNNANNWNPNQLPGISLSAFGTPTGGEIADFQVSASPQLSSSLTTTALVVRNNSTVNLTTGGNTLRISDTFSGFFLQNLQDNVNLFVSEGSSLNFSGNLRGSLDNFFGTVGNLDLQIAGNATFSGSINGEGQNVDIFGGGQTTLSNATVSNLDELRLTGNSTLILSNGSTIQGDADVAGGSTLKGSGTVTGNLSVDGTLSPGETGTGITVGGSLDGNGTWIFDAVNSATTDLVTVTGDLDVSGFNLSLSGTSSASSTNPVIIANYGTLSGGSFNSVSGLGPGQSIDYNFNGTGAIAIVPEVTNIVPLSLAFLPLLAMRNRRSRSRSFTSRLRKGTC